MPADGGNIEPAESLITKKTSNAMTPMFTRSDVASIANIRMETTEVMQHGITIGYKKTLTSRSSQKRNKTYGWSVVLDSAAVALLPLILEFPQELPAPSRTHRLREGGSAQMKRRARGGH